MQSQDQNSLYRVVNNLIPKNVLSNKNRARTWLYGYNEKYDIVVISRNGTLGKVIEINKLKIGLPAQPKKVYSRSVKKEDQYWEATPISKELNKIKSIFQWHETPDTFKSKWVDYIEEEFDRREQGYWFMNNGIPTYITGTHYMYLQWTKIDVGNPDYREANRIFYIFWMQKKCLQIKLFLYLTIILFSLNRFKMVWISLKQNWLTEFLLLRLLKKTCTL